MSSIKKINKLALHENLVSSENLLEAQRFQQENNITLHEALVSLGFIDGEELAKTLSKQFDVPYMDLNNFSPNEDIIRLVSPSFLRKHNIIPVSKIGQKHLVVATSDPSNTHLKNDLESVTQMTVRMVVANPVKIKEEINSIFTPKKVEAETFVGELESAEDDYISSHSSNDELSLGEDPNASAVVKFVNAILSEAIQTKASDIHIEVYETKCRVRYRVDGKLIEKLFPPKGTAAAIVSRVKVMSQLDIAEKRRPQDGRLKVKDARGNTIDFRVSVVPVLFGEKVVLRVLDKSNLTASLDQLNLTEDQMTKIIRNVTLPQGMVLLTGPTGSGKTTTIYSILNELNKKDTNISTAEDPVEYNIDGINQVHMKPEIGLNFAMALRAFLRQDPDVIMVGEIRDLETAEVAFKAASTGHMVVSTLHTNNSVATITRLSDIGIQPFIITDTISLIIAQRLVRLNCKICSRPHKVDDKTLLNLGVPKEELSEYENILKGNGCVKCNQTGFKGRIPIFEILEMTPALREGIIRGESNAVLRKTAIKEGLVTLRMSALLRLRQGKTTVEEVINSSVGD